MAARLQSPDAIRQWLVRLADLNFDDFLLIAPKTLDRGLWTPELTSDWCIAVNNAPHVAHHLHSSTCNLQPADCRPAGSPPSLADVLAAQQRLVTHFAYDLLRAKAPPLYDSLPWHDWDFSTVIRRFPLWKTRFLLAGDGTTVTMCRCRKSAGVYVVEPDESISRYVECKAAIERIRRFRLVSPKPQASSFKLSEIPLPDNSADLAVIGSSPYLQTADCRVVTEELGRVSTSVLLIENNPLAPPLDEKLLTASGLQPASVAVFGLGQRRCWWYTSPA